MIAARFSLVVAASLFLAVGCATAAFAQPKEAAGALRVLETPHFRISYATGEVFAEKRGEPRSGVRPGLST